ncbi:hypothetical protein BGZ63DRAFT_386264 [Mariannaea sp. PMI_226]|nr:hypothetical protein BGZ63DRAFT_386264 [Mariannaea sp. PMI_226]
MPCTRLFSMLVLCGDLQTQLVSLVRNKDKKNRGHVPLHMEKQTVAACKEGSKFFLKKKDENESTPTETPNISSR